MASPTNPQPETQNFRFQIVHLFYLTGVYATGLALDVGTLVSTSLWIIFYATVWYANRDQKILALGVVCLFGCCSCVIPSVNQPYFAAKHSQCSNNQRQMMLAMLNYESAHLVFPDGQPKSPTDPPYSWRVAILPFIECQDLYDQYDFSEPWDGPNNSKLLSQMPDTYRCPVSSGLADGQTAYKVVTGPGTLFDEGVEPTFRSIRDGFSNTAAIVEDVANPVPWTKPEDISIDQAIRIYSNPSSENAPHFHETLFNRSYYPGNITFYDGSRHRFGQFKDPADAAKLFGINNGIADLDNTRDYFWSEPRYDKIVAAVIYVILILAPLFFMPWKSAQKNESIDSTDVPVST